MKSAKFLLQRMRPWLGALLGVNVLTCGCILGSVLNSLLTPLPAGHFRLDAYDEVRKLAGILNYGLPIGVLTLVASVLAEFRAKTLNAAWVLLCTGGLVGVFAAAFATFSGLESQQEGARSLWSIIWWRIGS